jgi:copper homeostasis protein
MMLEVCAYNIQSCRIAEKAGARRIELCADPAHGGVTPSAGLIRYMLEHIAIPVFPMIRPRGGNFIYDDDELAIMRQDIALCRDMGCAGIATGVQLQGGRIDVVQLRQLVEWAYPMEVTCHKVFDRAPEAAEALEDVIASGCTRVLTSGLRATAVDGVETLRRLVAQAAGRIVIMPGGGVRSGNIGQLATTTGAKELHSSGLIAGNTNYIADYEEVRLMAEQLERLQ